MSINENVKNVQSAAGEGTVLDENMSYRQGLKDRQRIVVKVGSSSLLHSSTHRLDYHKIDVLVRELSDLKNRGKDVILVSSGATAVGREVIRRTSSGQILAEDSKITVKQACAAIGQAQLMMTYQKLFREYGHLAAQILLTRDTVYEELSRHNALNTFNELFDLGAVPIVNENDTISTYEIEFGDNDSLSATVSALIDADLLILLSDIDGLYSDDPHKTPDARFISFVEDMSAVMGMGKDTGSDVGTGGMRTKLHAAQIATDSGTDMIIANGENFHIIHRLIAGEELGTLFWSRKGHA